MSDGCLCGSVGLFSVGGEYSFSSSLHLSVSMRSCLGTHEIFFSRILNVHWLLLVMYVII